VFAGNLAVGNPFGLSTITVGAIFWFLQPYWQIPVCSTCRIYVCLACWSEGDRIFHMSECTFAWFAAFYSNLIEKHQFMKSFDNIPRKRCLWAAVVISHASHQEIEGVTSALRQHVVITRQSQCEESSFLFGKVSRAALPAVFGESHWEKYKADLLWARLLDSQLNKWSAR